MEGIPPPGTPPLGKPNCAWPEFIVFCVRKRHFCFQCGDENVTSSQKHWVKTQKKNMSARSLLQLRLNCCFFVPSLRNCCSRPSLQKWPKRSGHSHFLCTLPRPRPPDGQLNRNIVFLQQKLASGLQNASRLAVFGDANNGPPRQPTSSRCCKDGKRTGNQ